MKTIQLIKLPFCLCWIIWLSIYTPLGFAASSCDVAQNLNWVQTGRNLCGGYYQEPSEVLSCETPAPIDASTTSITADSTVLFSTTSTSHLSGNIVVTQPGRRMLADRAVLYRHPVTHEISQIALMGHVHYYEAGKHLVAQSVFVDLQTKFVRLDSVIYRLARKNHCNSLNAWGQAKCVIRRSDQDIELTQGSYTTCPPIHPTWKIQAQKLRINREEGWGSARYTTLFVHDQPLLSMPYFSFSIDKRRKSGWLFPTVSYSNDDGVRVRFPYYLNLAPNYDATLIPSYIFHRGAALETNFRYLTRGGCGRLVMEGIPYDREFAQFRETADAVFGITPETEPFLSRIHSATNSRGMLKFNGEERFNCNLWASLALQFVTDDYYLQDFAYNPYSSSNDQLLNQLDINYATDNWRFLGRIQAYQTLHPINQQPILDQYARLPQLFFTSDFPELPNRLCYQINGEYGYFDHANDFITDEPFMTGQRVHLQPMIGLPLRTAYSFFIPKLRFDVVNYDLHDTQDSPTHPTRALPIASIDTGIYLERQFGRFQQTLEPRLFYLYVPEKNQDNLPIFDTTLPSFNFAQLFRINRFVGYDRLGDANQLSVALTTRFLDGNTGIQYLRASIGQILYFKPPQVSLTCDHNNDLYFNESGSPLVGELNYRISSTWNGIADVALDPDDYTVNNASVKFHYTPNPKQIFNMGYDFVRNGDTLTTYALNSSKNNLNRINFALAWQLTDHWQALLDWNYNLSHGHPQAYFYGAQYDSCCWAVRIVASRILTAENVNDNATFQTNIYVQLQLKGLGNIGNSNPGELLTSSILGYQDNFRS